MAFTKFNTKEAQEIRSGIDVLNPQLFFLKQVYGRVVNYDEKSYVSSLSAGAKHHVLRKLQTLMREEINRFYQNDDINHIGYQGRPSRILELIVDTHEAQTFIKQCVFEKSMTFTEAYQLTLKLFFKREKDSYSRYDDHVIKIVHTYMKQLSLRLTSNVNRVLLERLQKTISDDFILVIEQFLPEIFFQPSDHLKGIIYRKKHKQTIFNHYAIYYQIPIFYSQDKFDEDTQVIFNIETLKLISNPTDDLIDQHNNLVYSGTKSYFREPFDGDEYKIHAMIMNYRDARYFKSNSIFHRAVIYSTDVVVAAKGAVLTEKEWEQRLQYIFKMFKGEEIIIRLPGFDSHITLDELCGRQTSIEMYADHPEFYEPLIQALSSVYLKHLDKKLTIVVPHLLFQLDYETWQAHLKYAFESYGINQHVSVIFECDNEFAMHEVDALKKSDGILMNLDYLATEYIPDFVLSHDLITLDMLVISNIFADLQYAKEVTRRPGFNTRKLLLGFNLQKPDIFKRLLVAGFKEMIIPIQTPHHFIDIIDKRIKNKGKYIGVYEEEREKTLFYREYKKKNNIPGAKRPYGLYKRIKEEERKKKEEEKKNKENKGKKDSNNDKTNE